MKSLLETLLEPLDRVLVAAPLETARWSTVAFLVLAALATWLLPRAYVFRSAPRRSRLYDLRLWACLIMLPYVLIYLLV